MRLWTLLLLLSFGYAACAPPPPKTPARRAAPTRRAAPDPLQLNLARPGHPRGLVRLRQGERLDAVRGEKLSWAALTRRLARARVIFVGERHDHRDHHRIQATVIQRLASAPGAGPLHVGMEMLYRGHAPAALRRWVNGDTAEAQFLQEVGWRKQWGMDFGLYRPVFAAARKHKLPMAGLNVPLRIARTVGRRGLGALTPQVRATLPRLHLGPGRHRQVFRAMLGLPLRARARPAAHPRMAPPSKGHSARRRPHGHPHHGFMGRLFSAQVLRDEVMAAEIVKTLEAAGSRARMVVIVGNGHLLYHTGVNHRLRRLRPRWPQATVICVSAGPQGRQVSRGLGDFLVGTAHRAPSERP